MLIMIMMMIMAMVMFSTQQRHMIWFVMRVKRILNGAIQNFPSSAVPLSLYLLFISFSLSLSLSQFLSFSLMRLSLLPLWDYIKLALDLQWGKKLTWKCKTTCCQTTHTYTNYRQFLYQYLNVQYLFLQFS